MPAYSDITVRVDQKDDAARRAITSFANHYIREARRVEDAWKKVGMGSAPRSGGTGGGRTGGGPKADDPMERARAHKAAMDAMARQEAAFAGIREKYTGRTKKENAELTKTLIADMKRLQDEKVKATNAIKIETDKAIKSELTARRNAIDQELRMMKSVALERQSVIRGGAGAPAGILGTGRNLISSVGGAIPGAGLVGGTGPAAGIAAAAMVLKKVIDVGVQFQDSMTQVKMITGLTADQMKVLGEKAREASVEFGTSASEQMIGYQRALGALGPELAQDADLLNRFNIAANKITMTTGTSPEDATRSLTVAVNAFGLATASTSAKVEFAERTMNAYAAAARAGNAEVPDLAESMKAGGATAFLFGQSIEEASAAIEVLAANEIKGAEAGTAYRNILTLTGSGTKRAAEQLEKVGLTFADINIKQVGYVKSMENLKRGYDSLKTPVEQAAFITKIFGRENQNAAVFMMNNVEMYKQFVGDIQKGGVIEEQMADRQKDMSFQWEVMKAKMEETALTVFESIKPALDSIMSVLSPLIDIVGVLVDATLTLGKVWWDFSNILSDIVLETIKALIGGGDDLQVTWKDIIKGVHEGIKVFGDFARGAIRGAVIPAAQALSSAIRWLWKNILQPLGHYISTGFTAIWNKLKSDWNTFTSVISAVAGGLKTAWEWFKNLYTSVSNLANRVPALGAAFRVATLPIYGMIRAIDAAKRAIASLPGIGGGGSSAPGGGSSTLGRASRLFAGDSAGGQRGAGFASGSMFAAVVGGSSGTTSRFSSTGIPTGEGGAGVGGGGGGGGRGGGGGGGGSKKTAAEIAKEEYDKLRAELDAEQAKELNKLKQFLLEKRITQSEYEFFVLRMTAAHAKAQYDLAVKSGQDTVSLMGTLLDSKLSILKKEQDEQNEAAKKRKELHDEELKRLKEMSDAQSKAMQARVARHRETRDQLADEQRAQLEAGMAYQTMHKLLMNTQEFTFGQMNAEWMRWTGRFMNQNTALFQVLNGIYEVGIDKLGAFVSQYTEIAATWIAQNLEIGASAIAKAIAAGVAWLWETSPWLAIGGGLALVGTTVAFWNDIKKSLGFVEHAEGGIFNRPVFTRDANGGGHVAGEAGPEVIAPLAQLRQIVGDEFAARVGTGRFRPGEALSGLWGGDFRVAPTKQLLQDAIDTMMTISIVVPGVKNIRAANNPIWDPTGVGGSALRQGRPLPATGFADTLTSVVVDSLKGVKLVTAIDQDRMELSRKRQVTRDAIGRM